MQIKSIKEYLLTYGLDFVLPDIRLCVFEHVYVPKLDSFLLASRLWEIVERHHRVLDIGTGSGILALVAACKGASVVATDVHEPSVRCAEYNAHLNGLSIETYVGNLFSTFSSSEVFDLIVSNMTSLPSPVNEVHDDYTARNIDAGFDGRRYLDELLNEAPRCLKKGGHLLIQHSNFANIEKTEAKLKELGYETEVKMYEYPVGEMSAQRIKYFLNNLPQNCHPVSRKNGWYQRIGVFKARTRRRWEQLRFI